MSRRDARTIALKSLFALDFDQEKTEQTAAETVASLATEEEFAKVGKKDRAYALALVEGTEKIRLPLMQSWNPCPGTGKWSA